jgi:nicotinamide mononucleotide transporter
MAELLTTLIEQAAANTWLELIAVILGVAYLLLAMRENSLCWYAAFVSTAIFLWVFWQVNLFMESGLQVFYLIMAVYGWYLWRREENPGDNLHISSWSGKHHMMAIIGIIVLSSSSGYLLNTYTDARLPYVDSLTTWGAIITTFMVAKKILENWIYWFVIDAVSIYLYLDRGLYFTALLFTAYVVIVVFGYLEWRQRYLQQAAV